MASPSIRVNLLSDRKRQLRKRQVLVAKIQLVSGVLLAIYITVLLIVMAFKVAVGSKLSSTQKAIKDEELKISQLSHKEVMYTVIENKVSLAGDFLDSRKALREAFEKMLDLLPENAFLEAFSVDDHNDSITVKIVVSDVFVAVALLDAFEESVDNEEYDYVSIIRYTRGKEGAYTVTGLLPI